MLVRCGAVKMMEADGDDAAEASYAGALAAPEPHESHARVQSSQGGDEAVRRLVVDEPAAAAAGDMASAHCETVAEAYEVQERPMATRKATSEEQAWQSCVRRGAKFAADPRGVVPLTGLSLTTDMDLPRGWRWGAHSAWEAGAWSYAADLRDVRTPLEPVARWHHRFRVRRYTRPILCLAGLDLRDALTGEVRPVSLQRARHVVLIIHGTGVHDDTRLKRGVLRFRQSIADLHAEGLPVDKVGGVLFDYISYNAGSDTGGEGRSGTGGEPSTADLLRSIQLSSIPLIRNALSHVLGDALSYAGPQVAAIRQVVAARLKQRMAQLRATTPFLEVPPGNTAAPLVTVVGHSLGSVIGFDLLAAAEPAVDIKVAALIGMGSPLGLFHAMRATSATQRLDELARLRERGIMWSNVYAPADPVAYRLAPLFPGRFSVEPELLGPPTSHEARTTFVQQVDRVCAARRRVADAASAAAAAKVATRDSGAAVGAGGAGSAPGEGQLADVPVVVAGKRAPPPPPPRRHRVASTAPMPPLDYELPRGASATGRSLSFVAGEGAGDYVDAATAHKTYWRSASFMMFLLSRLMACEARALAAG